MTYAQTFDKIVRHADGTNDGLPMIIYASAANIGEAPAYNQVTTPATAKNVIAVGATESYNLNVQQGSLWAEPGGPFAPLACNEDPVTKCRDNGNDIWHRSRRGDKDESTRIKPDLVAPGTGIEGPRTTHDTSIIGCLFGQVGTRIDEEADRRNQHYWSRGTSFAAPSAAGAGALLFTWFKNITGVSPKPSLLKAMQTNLAYDVPTVGPPPNTSQGWGKADFTRAFRTDNRYYWSNEDPAMIIDTTTPMRSFPSPTASFRIRNRNLPVRVTLVWTDRFKDPPGVPTLVNNLDLNIRMIPEQPEPKCSIGNDTNTATRRTHIRTCGLGQPDTTNNVEQVVFTYSDVQTDEFRVEVIRTALTGDALNVWGGPQEFRQDFSLFIDNVVQATPPPAVPALSAEASSGTQITLAWTLPTPPATSFEVQRSTAVAGPFQTLASVSGSTTSFTDTTPLVGETYIYRLRASFGGDWFVFSNLDPATIFTDDPIIQGATEVKAAHITQLRKAVDVRRGMAELSGAAWTPAQITPGLVILANHLQQLRSNLDEAIGPPSPPYSEAISPGVTIKRQHIFELRERVK